MWSKKDIDLSDPFQKKWYLTQVLTHGNAEDVAELDWSEIKLMLPDLNLPRYIRRLWEDILDVNR